MEICLECLEKLSGGHAPGCSHYKPKTTKANPTTTAKHSSTPWTVGSADDADYAGDMASGGLYIQQSGGGRTVICEMDCITENRAANAAFIVRACNSHAALVDACRAALPMLTLQAHAAFNAGDTELCNRSNATHDAIRVALALAEGSSAMGLLREAVVLWELEGLKSDSPIITRMRAILNYIDKTEGTLP